MLGADQSLVSRYFDWLGGLLTGDLGTSLASGQPVSELISEQRAQLRGAGVPRGRS